MISHARLANSAWDWGPQKSSRGGRSGGCRIVCASERFQDHANKISPRTEQSHRGCHVLVSLCFPMLVFYFGSGHVCLLPVCHVLSLSLVPLLTPLLLFPGVSCVLVSCLVLCIKTLGSVQFIICQWLWVHIVMLAFVSCSSGVPHCK